MPMRDIDRLLAKAQDLAVARELAGDPLWEMPQAHREALGKLSGVVA